MSGKQSQSTRKMNSFLEFYPHYLNEHTNITNRRFHFLGTSIAMLFILYSLLTISLHPFLYVIVIGYGFAWAGHFFFEKNKPATFKHPLYSVMGDFKMWYQMITGSLKI